MSGVRLAQTNAVPEKVKPHAVMIGTRCGVNGNGIQANEKQSGAAILAIGNALIASSDIVR